MLDLNEVAVFVEIIRAGSFASAARRLGIPPNTLSRRVRQLEERLDTRLMHRSTRKLTMTSAGQAFFDRCAPAIEGVLRAGQELVEGSHTPSGSIRVAAPVGFLESFRMEWVAAFLAMHPKVRLDFVLDDAMIDLIAEGIDIAFRAGHSQNATFLSRHILAQHFSLVASPAYVAVRGNPKALEDLAKHACLTWSTRPGRLLWRMQGPNGSEDVEVTGPFSASDGRALLKACLFGLGIALLPTFITASEIADGHLVHVLPDYRRESGGLHLVFPNRQQIPPAVEAFARFATERLRPVATPDARPHQPKRRRRK